MRSGVAVFRRFCRASMARGRHCAADRGRRFGESRFALIGVALAAAALPLSTVSAQTTAYAPGDGSPNSIALAIDVKASVGGRCGFADTGVPNGNVDTPNFDVVGINGQFQFRLNCTGPSRVAVLSTNGGLLNGGATTTGYTGLAPYSVTLTLVPNAGSPVTATCTAASLKAGAPVCAPTDFRGTADQTTGLKLNAPSTVPTSTLAVSAPAYSGASTLIAGNYSDTLTVTVSPSS